MGRIEFTPFQKIARLNRDITITEKIDGTNAAVVIVPLVHLDHIEHEDGSIQLFDGDDRNLVAMVERDGFMPHAVFAQSRSRFITPTADNYGFAGWVQRNAEALVETLGEGTHFGEWWGSGIQRKYGLTGADKRFSLFNSARWADADLSAVLELGVVPVLYSGPFSQDSINTAVDSLRWQGSLAAPGFMRPEGIVVWHQAERTYFKVTLEGDEAPKGAAGHALDEERAA